MLVFSHLITLTVWEISSNDNWAAWYIVMDRRGHKRNLAVCVMALLWFKKYYSWIMHGESSWQLVDLLTKILYMFCSFFLFRAITINRMVLYLHVKWRYVRFDIWTMVPTNVQRRGVSVIDRGGEVSLSKHPLRR